MRLGAAFRFGAALRFAGALRFGAAFLTAFFLPLVAEMVVVGAIDVAANLCDATGPAQLSRRETRSVPIPVKASKRC